MRFIVMFVTAVCVLFLIKTRLHRIKILVFFRNKHMWCYDAYFITNYVIIDLACVVL